MSASLLEFPPIAGSEGTAVAVVSIKDAALAKFTKTEAALRITAEKWRGVAFDVATPKGLNDAKAARHELREYGRLAVQRVRDATKDELNDLKRTVVDEAERLIAIVQPVEDAIDGQIKAREAVLAAEKAECERIEAQRIAKHRAGIDTLRSYIAQAQSKTSEQIARVLPNLEALDCGPAVFEEFSDEACKTLGEVTFALRELHDTTKAREDEAARIEAQRIGQARVAAEQRETQLRLDERAAALARQQQELADRERAAAEARMATAYDAARTRAGDDDAYGVYAIFVDGEIGAQVPLERVDEYIAALDALPVAVPAAPPVATPEGDKGPAPTRPVEQDAQRVLLTGTPVAYAGNEAQAAQASPSGSGGGVRADVGAPPTLNLGNLCERLGFIVSAELLGTLGFAATMKRSSRLYYEEDFQAICAAIAAHVLAVGERYSK